MLLFLLRRFFQNLTEYCRPSVVCVCMYVCVCTILAFFFGTTYGLFSKVKMTIRAIILGVFLRILKFWFLALFFPKFRRKSGVKSFCFLAFSHYRTYIESVKAQWVKFGSSWWFFFRFWKFWFLPLLFPKFRRKWGVKTLLFFSFSHYRTYIEPVKA